MGGYSGSDVLMRTQRYITRGIWSSENYEEEYGI